MRLEIELRGLPASREGVMRALTPLSEKSQPFRYLARIIKPNILRILPDMLDQFPPLGHLVIPPVVAKGNKNFLSRRNIYRLD
jgi:hypothetical protein